MKSKQELIDEINEIIRKSGGQHKVEPPFSWQKEETQFPVGAREFWEDEFSDYIFYSLITDGGSGTIMSRKHWEELKICIDNFYKRAEEKDFDIDYFNLKQSTKWWRRAYGGQANRRNKKSSTKDKGSIYLLKGDGCYKIGKAKDPISRTNTFTVKLPFEVELLHTVKSDQYSKLESFLHNKFSNKRINGEWFDLNQEDIEYIKNLEGDEYA